MNKAEIFLLIMYTTMIIALLSFSYVSLFFNIMLLIWILVHFTLVVVITSFLLKKATEQETKKEIAWIIFGVIFILSGIAGFYFFPTEEISRLMIIEPGILFFSLLSIFSILKLKDNFLLNNKFIFYISVCLMIIFIIYSIFLPSVNKFFVKEVSYQKEVLKIDYFEDREIFIPISETTLTNPTPISLPVPVDQVYYCLYFDESKPSYYHWNHESINFHSVEEAWFDIEGSDIGWKTYKMLVEKSNRVVGDGAYTGYDFYQYTDKRPLIYKIPPFKTITIRQSAKFDGLERGNIEEGLKVGYMLSDTNIIKIVERGKNRLPGGAFPCQKSKVITSINLR